MTMISVLGDPSDQYDDPLVLTNTNVTVTYKLQPVAVFGPELALPTHAHEGTVLPSAPAEGSKTVFIWEVVEETPTPLPVHRIGDGRTCLTHVTSLPPTIDGTEPEPRTVLVYT